ncbi:MAG TPA: hypothetical protein VHD32_14110 [Candidatus Didemnitutus sp.]|nr:hypothetical protein [Candidatus Didemnitutus sp.]
MRRAPAIILGLILSSLSLPASPFDAKVPAGWSIAQDSAYKRGFQGLYVGYKSNGVEVFLTVTKPADPKARREEVNRTALSLSGGLGDKLQILKSLGGLKGIGQKETRQGTTTSPDRTVLISFWPDKMPGVEVSIIVFSDLSRAHWKELEAIVGSLQMRPEEPAPAEVGKQKTEVR